MGTREVALEDNGMDAEKMKWQQLITPEKNVYYSVNVLFPEAIFIAVAVPHIYSLSSVYYGSRGRRAPLAEATYIPQRHFQTLEEAKEYSMSLGKRKNWLEYAYNWI